ncbi:sigma-54-dependent Fis family transcriptional regulator [Aliishimia ponticola]|uniref:Sigma-54-dependent Fis family transcriptional regulator n=1 Tax=Aliishimia ponticola TaxID=2499833 RepID=A0A4V3XKZ5_9RHOB|nr:sigma-54 dependent transcriptional regulator [Aliishimia ponticola]THH38823.1 sigma-54-dependent Fis family transcriptional regulator [Aliishimia ponticola]
MMRQVLVVDDDRELREALAQTLELHDLDPIMASSFVAAKDHISKEFDGVVLSDIRMPGRDGFHLLSYARACDPDLPIVLLTGEGDIPMAVKAMGQGAFDFLEKPCASKDLIDVLERALRTRALVQENRRLRTKLEQGDPAARMLFGQSGAAEALRDRVRRIAEAGSDALILGPSGSGISKVAEVVHLSGNRSKAPFVKRAAHDLGPEACQQALDVAQGGSLFLDEAVRLPMETQLLLAEALDDAPRPRLYLGATTDLEAAVEEGRLHGDLYYRLSGVSLRIPSLSERREDIPVLFRHYVELAAEQAGLEPPEVTPALVSDLMGRDWPGNARALMSEAMRFVLGLRDERPAPSGLGLAEQMAQVERTILEHTLQRVGGRAAAAAEALKLPRKTFYDKLARHGIRAETFRSE